MATAEIEEHQGQFAVSSVVSKPPNSSPFAVQPCRLLCSMDCLKHTSRIVCQSGCWQNTWSYKIRHQICCHWKNAQKFIKWNVTPWPQFSRVCHKAWVWLHYRYSSEHIYLKLSFVSRPWEQSYFPEFCNSLCYLNCKHIKMRGNATLKVAWPSPKTFCGQLLCSTSQSPEELGHSKQELFLLFSGFR
jgi:hypothetical protein